MLKNNELELLHNAYTILYSENYHEIGQALEEIYNKYSKKKQQASEKANAWNKIHPDKHRKHNKDYAKRKREGGNKNGRY